MDAEIAGLEAEIVAAKDAEINDLEKKLKIHELVCRIPIPLTPETGFIGKINSGIL